MRIRVRELVSVPNCLSYIRILLIPFFVLKYLHAEGMGDYFLSAFLIFLSGLTDFFDGWIARRLGMVTQIGKILDPIADKFTQAAIAFCLTIRYEAMWILVTLFVIKELSMGIYGLAMLRRGKKLDGALWYGKVSTFVFYAAMILLIGFPSIGSSMAAFLISVTCLFLFLSFFLYMRVYLQMSRE